MRRFVGFALAAGTLTALTAAVAPALMIAVQPAGQRALTADAVVVGKVTAVEKETVEAAPFPNSPQKLQYKIAVVKVETPLIGAGNATHLKVGFIPAPPAQPPVLQPVNPGGPVPAVIRRPIRRFDAPELKEGKEYVLFLTKHANGGFYIMPPMSPPLDMKNEATKQEIANIKKVATVLADPMKSLKSEKAEDRYFAAATLITKYRSYPNTTPGVAQEPIPAEESQLIFAGLRAGDWAKFDRAMPNGLQAFYSLGLTEKDGWVPPKPMPAKPGQPQVNYNQLTQQAFEKWYAGPGKDYRIKRFVAAPTK